MMSAKYTGDMQRGRGMGDQWIRLADERREGERKLTSSSNTTARVGHDLHSTAEDTGKDGNATSVPQQLAQLNVVASREPFLFSFPADVVETQDQRRRRRRR